MAYSELTIKGKAFITEVCKRSGLSLLTGRNKYSMPYTSPPLDKTWTCNIVYNGAVIVQGISLANALIDWFDMYGEMYQMDANVLAAQAYIESKFIMWDFANGASTASGVNQFPMLNIYNTIVANEGNSNKMTTEEQEKITGNLTDRFTRDSYNVGSKTFQNAYKNHPLLHQNIIDNPEIMIKAQARRLKNIANDCDSLASTSLFCYSRGPYMSHTYTRAIEKCDKANSGNPDYTTLGLSYVLKIFGVLGDENNTLEPQAGIGYKIPKFYFGYDTEMGKNNNKNLKLVSNIWSPYDANVDESSEYNLQGDFTENKEQGDPVVVELSTYPKYKFIYFPETYYFPEKTDKSQIVLHHTASPEGSGNDILWWEHEVLRTGDKVSVSFIVTRNGTILQLFSTNYWAYHLGISENLFKIYGTPGIDNMMLNSRSIGIEIDNWGGLINSGGKWYPPMHESTTAANTNAKPIPATNVITYNSPDYPKGYHGFYGFERYTDDQISALRILINAIKKGFPKIPLQYVNEKYTGVDMWGKDIVPGVWTAEPQAYAEKEGIWTHVSYVPSKSDCQPQPQLVDLLKTL